jgi:hypothetical protein
MRAGSAELMLVAAGFLHGLSVFAAVALCALVTAAVIWLVVDQVRKWRMLAQVRDGLKALARVEDELQVKAENLVSDELDPRPKLGDGPVVGSWLFLLAALPNARLSERQARRLSETSLALLDPDGLADLADRAHLVPTIISILEDSKLAIEARRLLNRARPALGSAPLTAIEYVLEREPKLARQVGSAAQVAGYLQRCDLIERAVFAVQVGPTDST